MTYEEALEYIHGSWKLGNKLGLHNMEKLLGLMGNPHKKLRFVHVAGTNGKGSTSAFIASILMQAGYRTGLYTSPFIQRFTERIQIGTQEISREELADITAFVKRCADQMELMGDNHPTEFEIVTAVAFEYYFRKACDIVVLEVGLGGRFDPTNIIETPELAVITTINYDHTDMLGDTLPKIAFEKAGIIKHHGDVVIYSQSREVEQVFEDACVQRGAHLYKTDFSEIELHEFGPDGQVFSSGGYSRLEIGLLGRHQIKNALVAVRAAEILSGKGFDISQNDMRNGLANAKWPARLEIIQKDPVLVIDGAHNPEGAVVLRSFLDEYFPGKPVTFIMGVLSSKDYLSMINTVLPGCKRLFAVTPGTPKALPAALLADAAASYCNDIQISDTIEEAVRTSIQTAGPDEIICAFGSLYFIGAVRNQFGL
jgi:dihydrofolate synthase/folylpolyglutamate synthase